MRHATALLYLLCLPALLWAQTPTMPTYHNIAVGMSHRTGDSTLVHNANVGLVSGSDSLVGAQVGVLSSLVRKGMAGVNAGGLFAVSLGSAIGLQAAGLTNGLGERLYGLQVAGISNVASEVSGAQVSAMDNISRTPLRGVQLAGVSNISMGVNRGVQFSPVTNISSGTMQGVQVGTFNYADTVRGVQVGPFNVCLATPHGAQIGIVNYSRDSLRHQYGLINIRPDTRLSMMFYAGTSSKLSTAVMIQNHSSYDILGIGPFYHSLSKKFSGALFYRIGKKMSLTPRWWLGADLGFFHIESYNNDDPAIPTRMYSLQPRVMTLFTSGSLGLYAAMGYESTHKYRGGTYRRGMLVEAGLSFQFHSPPTEREAPLAPYGGRAGDGVRHHDNTRWAGHTSKRRWLTAAEVTGLNTFVHCFDRFVLKLDYTETTMRSVRNNFKTAFVWDNDDFNTNMFAHPYHGNLYFNAARSNGMNFWQSYPYALGGSLMWEFFGENTPPSINDLAATSIGGSCIGETMFRISSLVLDDSKRGFARFWRELVAGVASPMRLFNRLVSGDAWRVRPSAGGYHDEERWPVDFSISAGTRYLADKAALFRGENSPYINVMLDYGDPLSEDNRPYDFFNADITFSLSANQPLINAIHLIGQLWSSTVNTGSDVDMRFGIYQHFNFYNSEAVKDGTDIVPYRIGEAASIGLGAIYRFPRLGRGGVLEQRIFFNGVLLGGSQSDYYRILDRDYNLGSGFSGKVQTMVQFHDYGRLDIHADLFRIFTWNGYDEERVSHLDNLEYTNAQGDVGDASLFVLSPHLQLNITRHLLFDLHGSYYYRRTYYRDHPKVSAHTFELSTGLTFEL